MNRNITAIDPVTTKDDWETPPAIWQKLCEDFGPFDLDLTANSKNFKGSCYSFLGPGSAIATDALTAPWSDLGTSGYSNPPYGKFIPHILRKALSERDRGFTSVFLLPEASTNAFHDYVLTEAEEIHFCRGRICFYEDGHPRWNARLLANHGKHVPDPAMKGNIVVVYRPWRSEAFKTHKPKPGPKIGTWVVPKHT